LNTATNSTTSTQHTFNATTENQPPTPSPKFEKHNMTRNANMKELAFATVHQANMTTTSSDHKLTNISNSNQSIHHKTATSINDWLVDSGCSIHMTNCIDDFNGPLQEYETLVEVANGGVTHVTRKGSVSVLINDHFQRENSIIVQLNNVLYLPGLSRRLLSVSE
jgi:hypothetical protein